MPPLHNGRILHHPARARRGQLRRGVWHVLIQLAGLPDADATCEPVEEFRALFPAFQPEDELFGEGGGEMLWSATSTSVAPREVAERWTMAGSTRARSPATARQPRRPGVRIIVL